MWGGALASATAPVVTPGIPRNIAAEVSGTPTVTHHERDAEDARLLANGDLQALWEHYLGVVFDRCRARVPPQDAADVAANVSLRILEELDRGRVYRYPFRVIVHMVTTWKIKEHFEPKKWTAVELDERLASDDPFRDLENDLDFATDVDRLLEGLAPREREVAILRIVHDLSPGEIASRLGINRNNVDQAWNRAKRKLVERMAT